MIWGVGVVFVSVSAMFVRNTVLAGLWTGSNEGSFAKSVWSQSMIGYERATLEL